MKPRTRLFYLTLTLLVCAFVFANTASADNYTCTLTGYTFMGGGSARTIDNGHADYLIAQPLSYAYADLDMWGFAWIKFDDIGTESVGAAYLNLDLLGVGGMNVADATESYPALLDIYSPGSIDVDDLAENVTLRGTLKDNLLSSTALVADYTMTTNGSYAIDITDIYNDWATGSADNNGIILVSDSGNSSENIVVGAVGAKFSSLGSTQRTAPYLSTSAVPVPAAVWLLGSGLFGLIGLRRRKK